MINEPGKIPVIFVCTGNSCRSQMAEGFLRHWTDAKIEARSAGSHPASGVARLAIQVMDEVGIDISRQVTNSFDNYINENFDWVITLCDYARDFCPVFKSVTGEAKRLHWSISDPMSAFNYPEKELSAYRDARDEIGGRIMVWLDEQFGIKVNIDPESKC